jgi:hypothetical protein
MELEINYDKENHVVIAVPRSDITSENVISTASKVLEFSKQHDCDYLLFDIRNCKEAQPLIEGYNTMQNIGKSTGLKPHHKCAIVYNPLKYSDQRAQFIENVVANRPNPLLRIFTSMEEAYKWLKEMQV